MTHLPRTIKMDLRVTVNPKTVEALRKFGKAIEETGHGMAELGVRFQKAADQLIDLADDCKDDMEVPSL